MKKLLLPLLLLTLHAPSYADVFIPAIDAPEELVAGDFAEGTLTRLSDADIAEFIPWAQNAHNQLTRALNQSRSMPLRDRPAHIERAVRSVVSRSGQKQYQMFMRFSLNRGMLLASELRANMDMEMVGAQENVLDILQRSIEIALSFYESDLAFQRRAQSGEATTELSYARFAAAFMNGMYPGVVNVLDATAQYRMLYKLVEMVNWDLSRDSNARYYADAIVEAYEFLQDMPSTPTNDDRANLRLVRRLNSLKILGVSQLYTQAQRQAQMTREQIEADNRRTAQEREEAARRAREEAEWERLRSGAGRSALQEEDLRQARLGLSAGSWEVRRTSVRKLEGIPGDDVTTLIIRTMLDSDSDVRTAAYSVASRRPLRSSHLLETLENVYSRSGSWETRRHIVYLLAPLKDVPAATSMLISYIQRDSDSDVQNAAYSALGTHSIGPANVEALFALARSSSWEKRRRAVWLMAKVPSMEVYRFLGDMKVRESDSDVQNAINSTLASMRRSLE